MKDNGKRERRVDKKGNIYEKDYMHSKEGAPVWEKYNKRGKHQGEVDDHNNRRKKPDPNKRIDP
ncbi:colicin E3/pyocin S6 family cytotoxin [Helicobacter cappadocius]|uniref:Colicin E3/pyocin S6 family cytotoxin n=1 Tax=Helicobacter cappadocius TaxID=3063998 RepID=A0AA90PXY2_9HELI|nr:MULTISPECIES: colicin E3/pyocin S6 family cytotoxin [unclassified Helicobacter]MDO7252695.1 colicin E3/pyocin S6 family cytotoxin [Helicobacter sp. faydin-H75]MDP2538563.1 colicin E3/pyocin S6 family cytotoxin [Helicobacter sp. faydin-H76]